MPFIDVNEVFADTNISGESFVVRRRTDTVGNDGLTQITYTKTTAYGTIFPEGGDLMRGTDAQYSPKVINIITPYRLQGPSSNRQPDTIIWDGDEFVITKSNDYTSYGAGFCEATAQSMDSVDAPP